jgi:hypothetical protein
MWGVTVPFLAASNCVIFFLHKAKTKGFRRLLPDPWSKRLPLPYARITAFRSPRLKNKEKKNNQQAPLADGYSISRLLL